MKSRRLLLSLVAAFSLVLTSHGALNWTVHPIQGAGTNKMAQLWEVAYGNGQFLAIERSGQTYWAPASEPRNWKPGAKIEEVDLGALVFADGRFAAAGQDTKTAKAVFLTSADGANWNRQAFETPGRWWDVAYGNGRFVIVGDGLLARSANGVVWVMDRSFVRSPTVHFRSVQYVNGEFIATYFDKRPEYSPYSPIQLAISTDGFEWKEHEIHKEGFGGVTYGRGVYLAPGVTDCGGCGWLYFSSDGRHWEERRFPAAYDALAIEHANGLFAISAEGTLLSSRDGAAWDEFKLEMNDVWLFGLTFGSGRFVAVGYSMVQEEQPRRLFWQGWVAVSDVVEELPYLSNVNVTEEAIEFGFNAAEHTQWLVETSRDLVGWTVLEEIEGTIEALRTVSIPHQGKPIRFFRLKAK